MFRYLRYTPHGLVTLPADDFTCQLSWQLYFIALFKTTEVTSKGLRFEKVEGKLLIMFRQRKIKQLIKAERSTQHSSFIRPLKASVLRICLKLL